MPNFLFLYWNQLYGTENKKRNSFQELKKRHASCKVDQISQPGKVNFWWAPVNQNIATPQLHLLSSL